MLNKLKEIYKEGLQEKVCEFDQNHYYFYIPGTYEVFGITKKITKREYDLLKIQYVEKKIFSKDISTQSIYEYLIENKKYPFKTTSKIIIYKTHDKDEIIVSELLSTIYGAITINVLDVCVSFLFKQNTTKVNELFNAISQDLGYEVCVHEGMYIDNLVNGACLYDYIKCYTKNKKISSLKYSDISDMVLDSEINDTLSILTALKESIYNKIANNQTYKEIINAMFNNDLNVSTSAKVLYMNRNSLINKLDAIYKETSLNIQKFRHASALYIILKFKQNV